MFDLVSDVAAVLLPLLAGGAGGAAQGALEHGGARVLDAVTHALAERADGDLDRALSRADVEQAVRDALAARTLTQHDLRALLDRPPAVTKVRAKDGGVAIGTLSVYGNLTVGEHVRRGERPQE